MQTVNVQFLSGRKDVSQAAESEKPVNVSENLNSNRKSFKSILESVKAEGMEEKKTPEARQTGLRADEQTSRAEKKVSVDDGECSSVRKSVAENDAPEKKEPVASKKNQRKTETENNESPDDENSITVEIDMDSFVQDDMALAQSIAAAADVAVQDVKSETTPVQAEGLDIEAVASVGDSSIQPEVTEFDALSAEEDSTVDSAVLASVFGSGDEAVEETVVSLSDEAASDSVSESVAVLSNGGTVQESLGQSAADASDEGDSETGVRLASEKGGEQSEREGVFTVTDRRTQTDSAKSIAADEGKTDGNPLGADNASTQLASNAGTPVQTSQTVSGGESFTQMLSQQIQNGAPEFVKAGNILLRDNNSGSINMVLKPENLGNVKVSLELSDKILSGQIVVQSREAYEAFRQSMDTLKQAFQNNGFENANLNLVLAENSNSNGSFAQGQQQSGEQYLANRTYSDFAQSGDASEVSSGSDVYTKVGDHQIDVVA